MNSKNANSTSKPSKNNNPSNAMSAKEDVRSNDKKMKQDFPGYPHYPAREDVMNPANNNGIVELSNEDNTTATGSESVRGEQRPTESENEVEDDLGIVEGTEADVTEEDLEILEGSDRGMVFHSTEEVRDADSLGSTGEDLDVPGSELDDDTEELGEEDEENNYYSLGGDNHENLEEDRGSINTL